MHNIQPMTQRGPTVSTLTMGTYHQQPSLTQHPSPHADTQTNLKQCIPPKPKLVNCLQLLIAIATANPPAAPSLLSVTHNTHAANHTPSSSTHTPLPHSYNNTDHCTPYVLYRFSVVNCLQLSIAPLIAQAPSNSSSFPASRTTRHTPHSQATHGVYCSVNQTTHK